jgi:hypothetical protein
MVPPEVPSGFSKKSYPREPQNAIHHRRSCVLQLAAGADSIAAGDDRLQRFHNGVAIVFLLWPSARVERENPSAGQVARLRGCGGARQIGHQPPQEGKPPSMLGDSKTARILWTGKEKFAVGAHVLALLVRRQRLPFASVGKILFRCCQTSRSRRACLQVRPRRRKQSICIRLGIAIRRSLFQRRSEQMRRLRRLVQDPSAVHCPRIGSLGADATGREAPVRMC